MLKGIRNKSSTVMTVSVNFGVSVGKLVFPSRKSTKRLPLAWCVELNCSLFITRFPFYFFLFVAVQAPSSSLWSWGPFIHYIKANFLMSWKKCGLMSIKSVHFKNPVMRSSFLSKSLSFTIQHQLNQNKVSWWLEITTILKEIRIAQLPS